MSDKPRHHGPSRFRNNYPHQRHGARDFLRFLWDWQRKPFARIDFPLAGNDPAFLAGNRTRPTLTWVGHSTFLVQLGCLNVLTDPHFTQRASPLAFAGPARLAPPGLALRDVPPLDLVLISHDHYDHLDEGSVAWLAQHHPRAVFAVPLGLRRWLQRLRAANIVELDWWQAHSGHGFTVSAVPAQHFSGRGATDRNRTLWCGFVVEIAGQRLFFAGDTGYSRDFADIGARFAPIDLALLPIGAYAPRWFMHPMHVNPEEAVRIHRDIGARLSVAMHWGTFRLTEEPLDEPPKQLAAELERAGVPPENFWIMQHGETRRLPFPTAA
ncbi:MAG TPA: MBL fold metallo-hydrolase [Verrucomicrobiae bacterium]|nr:MBL fold metallo-hydrolase [Verrucomicrobiae bacterium]